MRTKEEIKKYQKEKQAEYAKRFTEKHPERVKESRRKYYLKNKDKYRVYSRKRRKTIPGKYQRYRSRAVKAGRDFLLTLEQFSDFVNKSCHYCKEVGINGIDRKDNEKGYVLENCLPCCWTCNKFKGSMKYDDFISLCKKISINLD